MIKSGTPSGSLASQYHGIQVGSSAYGKTVKLIYGLAQAAPDMIWYNNWKTGSSPSNSVLASLTQGATKKTGKSQKKGNVHYFSAAVDLLIGHAPVLGVFSAWYNNQKFAVVINSASGIISGGQFTFTPVNAPSEVVVGFTGSGSPTFSVTEPNYVADRRVRDATLGDNFYLQRGNPILPPGPNQYTVTSGGLFTFNNAQSGHLLRITYFTSSTGSTPSTLVGILAASIHEIFTASFNDYGAPAAITQYGTWERPLWNAAFAVPGRIDVGATHARDPYTWSWDGANPVVTVPTALNGLAITAYYGTPVILKSDGTLFSTTRTPLNILNLVFEGVMGSGPEYANYSTQQVQQIWASGTGSVQFDLGLSNSMPNLNLECIGTFTQWPNGDADVADIIADIVASGPLLINTTVTTSVAGSSSGGQTGLSQQSPATLTAAANASGGNTSYTGTFSSGSNIVPFPPTNSVVIAGFTNAVNNGTFTIVSCSATTLVVINPSGVAELHAGTAKICFQVISAINTSQEVQMVLSVATPSNGTPEIPIQTPGSTTFILTGVVGATHTYSYSSYTGYAPIPGLQFVNISGFTNGVNNGLFLIASVTGNSSGGTFTVPAGTSNETHAGIATTAWQQATNVLAAGLWIQTIPGGSTVAVTEPFTISPGFPSATATATQSLTLFFARNNSGFSFYGGRTGASNTFNTGPFTILGVCSALLVIFQLTDAGHGLFTSPVAYSVTDSRGNTYTQIANSFTTQGAGANASGSQTLIFMAQSPPSGATTITSTYLSGPGVSVVSNQTWVLGMNNIGLPLVTPIGHGVNCNQYTLNPATAGSTTAPGNGTILGTLEPLRSWCRANGISSSLVQDAQRSGKDLVDELLTVGNSAPVYSGNQLNIIPYDEVSAAGGGAIYTAPTAAGPVANLTDKDFVSDGTTPPVSFVRKRRADCDNVVSVEYVDRSLDYSRNVVSEVDQKAVALYGPRKGGSLSAADLGVNVPTGSKSLTTIYSAPVAQAIGSILAKRGAAGVNQYSFSLKQDWLFLEAMDLVTISTLRLGLANVPVRLVTVKETAKRTLDCVADQFVYGLNHPGVHPTTATTGTIVISNVDPGLVNPPIIFQPTTAMLGSNTAPELWILASGSDPNYGGCVGNVSLDGGGSYPINIGRISAANTGVLTATFADSPDPDSINTLAVDLSESGGSLSTQSHPIADTFADPCYLAGSDAYHWEVICYTNVVLTSAEHFSLGTYIRRGALGTVHSAHNTGQRFAVIDGSLFKVSLPAAWVGITLYFKFQAFNKLGGQANSLANCVPYTYTPLAAYLPGGYYVNGG